MLGPEGKDFGQYIYMVKGFDLAPKTLIKFGYKVANEIVLNAQVVDTLGHGKLLTISREAEDGDSGRTMKMKDESDDSTSFFALKDLES